MIYDNNSCNTRELVNSMNEPTPCNFNFTVGEMIEVLKSFPSDLPVITNGFNSGYENIVYPCVIKVKHKPENTYHNGEFQDAKDNDKDTFEAVALRREVRD